MKLILLGFSKQGAYSNECIVEYSTKYKPMIISTRIRYDPKLLIKHQEYEADIKLWSFCWWSSTNHINHANHISNSCLPYSFIVSKIEEILEIKLDIKKPYVKYKTTLADQVFEMKICYPEQNEYDEPIKDTFKVGDTIVGLFKAKVKIKK